MHTIEIYEDLPGDETTVNDLIVRCEALFCTLQLNRDSDHSAVRGLTDRNLQLLAIMVP